MANKINHSLGVAIFIFASLVLLALALLGWYNGKSESGNYSPPYSNNTNNSTSERNFCSDKGREADFCTEQYDPVCGWFSQDIKCIKYPCAQTYSNNCFACQDDKVEYWTKGQCPA